MPGRSIPVSALDEEWLKTVFLVELQRHLASTIVQGGILWISVDSPEEGHYLLERIRRAQSEEGKTVQFYRVPTPDSFAIWHDLVGTPDTNGLLHNIAPEQLLLVDGAADLPIVFLKERIQFLQKICLGFRCKQIWAIVNRTLHDIGFDSANRAVIHVPPFSGYSDEQLKLLIRELLVLYEPGIMDEHAEILTDQILSNSRPATRTDLEIWMDGYFNSGNGKLGSVARLSNPQIPIFSQEDLRSRWAKALANLREADRDFLTLTGRPLLKPVQYLSDPYISCDPMHWFIGMVSFVSCIIDRVDKLFFKLICMEYVEKRNTIEAQTGMPEGYRLMRALRTLMQHGVEPGIGDAKISIALEWYRRNCGTDQPHYRQYRILCCVLIEEWDSLTGKLALCIRNIHAADNFLIIQRILDMYSRNVSKEEVRILFREAVVRLDHRVLDPEQLLDKYYQKMGRMIKEMRIPVELIEARVKILVEELVLREATSCPISVADLRGIGILKQQEIARAMQFARDLWDGNWEITRETLLAEIKARRATMLLGLDANSEP